MWKVPTKFLFHRVPFSSYGQLWLCFGLNLWFAFLFKEILFLPYVKFLTFSLIFALILFDFTFSHMLSLSHTHLLKSTLGDTFSLPYYLHKVSSSSCSFFCSTVPLAHCQAPESVVNSTSVPRGRIRSGSAIQTGER